MAARVFSSTVSLQNTLHLRSVLAGFGFLYGVIERPPLLDVPVLMTPGDLKLNDL